MMPSEYTPNGTVDTSYRQADYAPSSKPPSRLPSAIRRLSCNRPNSYSSDCGLVDNVELGSQRAPPSPYPYGADDPFVYSREPSEEERTENLRSNPRLPSSTRRLGRAPSRSDEPSTSYSSDEERHRYWYDDEGPPLPTHSWSASRHRQQLQQEAAQKIVDEPPPWWWYPCYHSDPETPWYDQKTKFGNDTYWEPALCADHIHIACKMAVTDAVENQEKQFAQTWKTTTKNMKEMFQDITYDWMPKVAKKPEKPIDNNYCMSSTFENEIIGCHRNLQIVSVPVDQIIREQQRVRGDFLPIWYSVKTYLRQVLCDAECGLYHMNIPKQDVQGSIMPDSLRDLRGMEQQVRDWVIFRDYKNLMQFYEKIFQRHTCHW